MLRKVYKIEKTVQCRIFLERTQRNIENYCLEVHLHFRRDNTVNSTYVLENVYLVERRQFYF